ncbi:MAG TPA: glycosyltransferase [Candidatus Acidoferrales bacterium]|nr:glycosyltransferase [Candidatus Acidoferrales bacterium]
MRILLISDLETMGGAAIAASWLAAALAGEGHEVVRVVATPDNRPHPWRTERLAQSRTLTRRAARRLLPVQAAARMDGNEMRAGLQAIIESVRPDAVNVHNLHVAGWQGWGHEMLSAIPAGIPVVWTLHDMWSFTGRCIYSGECTKFLTGCDAACPTPHEYPALAPEHIADAWEKRRTFFSAHREIAAVAPSHWMAQQASAGMWAGHRVKVIANGLPLETFRPMERGAARAALGVEARGPVLLVAAQILSERRMGGNLLAGALENLSTRPLTLLAMGSGEPAANLDGVRVHKLGYVEGEERRALAYNAADVVAYPAPVTNLPNVAVEAMACGTPVAAFAAGGMADIVTHGETGWLADDLTPAALAAALSAALESPRDALRARCRETAERKFSAAHQARRYVELFRSLGAPGEVAQTVSAAT